jgi:ABC-type bacteriocin/lantibiotic exporter with double-glycine peptidase domain
VENKLRGIITIFSTFGRPYRGCFFAAILLAALSAVMGFVLPFAVRIYIDYVLIRGNSQILAALILGLTTTTAISSLARYASTVLLTRFSEECH